MTEQHNNLSGLEGYSWPELETTIARLIERSLRDKDGPVLIAVGGPGGTGKTRFSRRLCACLPDSNVLALDDYKSSRKHRQAKGIFGPHPDANEMELISEHLAMIKSGLPIDRPVYNPVCGKADRTQGYEPVRFNIVEGEVATYQDFADLIDFHIFIDADLATQLQTRLTRDMDQRGYSLKKAADTFFGSNLREFGRYGAGTKAWADIVLHCRGDYSLSLDAVADHLTGFLPGLTERESPAPEAVLPR